LRLEFHACLTKGAAAFGAVPQLHRLRDSHPLRHLRRPRLLTAKGEFGARTTTWAARHASGCQTGAALNFALDASVEVHFILHFNGSIYLEVQTWKKGSRTNADFQNSCPLPC